jgi:hypothetical protein
MQAVAQVAVQLASHCAAEGSQLGVSVGTAPSPQRHSQSVVVPGGQNKLPQHVSVPPQPSGVGPMSVLVQPTGVQSVVVVVVAVVVVVTSVQVLHETVLVSQSPMHPRHGVVVQ